MWLKYKLKILHDGISLKHMYGNACSGCKAPADPQTEMGEMKPF